MRPALPGPDPQINPTFPRRRQQLPPSVPGTRATTTLSVRKLLKISVPRAPQRTPLLLDVIDIFDDADAWSIFVPTDPSTSISTSSSNIGNDLSQLRKPEALTSAYSAYDPVEIKRACVRDYATFTFFYFKLTFTFNLILPLRIRRTMTMMTTMTSGGQWMTSGKSPMINY